MTVFHFFIVIKPLLLSLLLKLGFSIPINIIGKEGGALGTYSCQFTGKIGASSIIY